MAVDKKKSVKSAAKKKSVVKNIAPPVSYCEKRSVRIT